MFQNGDFRHDRALRPEGHRKYLTPAEREAFLRAADDTEREVRTFCHVLLYTGCRISEALFLTADRVDLKDGTLIFESLKKRKDGVFRPVPIPATLIDTLNMVDDIRTAQKRRDRGRNSHLWPFSRTTAWRHVCTVMEGAKIKGPHASPEGLRHGYGIKAVTSGVPLNMLQQLGHAQLTTTAIYADAMGPEKRQLVERMCNDEAARGGRIDAGRGNSGHENAGEEIRAADPRTATNQPFASVCVMIQNNSRRRIVPYR